VTSVNARKAAGEYPRSVSYEGASPRWPFPNVILLSDTDPGG
jgi:hypothetical protein